MTMSTAHPSPAPPPFEASTRSLNAHRVPEWFDDAKFGIFIHWGLFSIPGFAAGTGHISDALERNRDSVVMSPYTEWYLNATRVPGSPTAKFHREHYGDRPYSDFRAPFERGLEHWDPVAWARLFKRAGARYVVLVSKHHDGYCLWPSAVTNPHHTGWTNQRDIVGELADAVRAEGLRFGLYYSGGIDWSFNTQPVRSFSQFVGSTPQGDYPAYADAQMRELIDRYKPSILWNDISWPSKKQPMLELMADYYAAVPEGVINDRWMHRNLVLQLISKRPVQRMADALIDWSARRAATQAAREAARGDGKEPEKKGVIPPRPIHSDFRTPEYTRFDRITKGKWETTRGMSPSFGYNRNHHEADYEPVDKLLHGFIDSVAKNGNLLLNVGPRGEDAQIPDPQVSRLEAMGDWLRANGEAIYGTRPWSRASPEHEHGREVRFTQRGDQLYAIVLHSPADAKSAAWTIETPEFQSMVARPKLRHLASGSLIEAEARDGRLSIPLPDSLANSDSPAHAFAIERSSLK